MIEVMDRLRSQGGCPWDREQTHESLVRYLLEETYELVDAIESGDRNHMREELGDVLLQVLFHARIAEEHPQQPFSIDDVAQGLADKLRFRHPHVFAPSTTSAHETVSPDTTGNADTAADARPRTAEDVRSAWEELKQQEKQRSSVLEGISHAQGALSRAQKVVGRLSRDEQFVTALEVPGQKVDNGSDAEVIGSQLLDIVRSAHTVGVDAESALRAAIRAVEARVQSVEQP